MGPTGSSARTDAVVVNYNAGDWLARCVHSLLADRFLNRLVVVDNGSTDGSLEALPTDPRLAIIRNHSNLGFAAAVNAGAAGLASEYLAVVNPDLELPTPFFERLQGLLDQRTGTGIVGIRILNPDGSDQRAARRATPTPGRSAATMLRLERVGLPGVNLRGPIPDHPVEIEAVSGAFLFLRRACWDELGGFDPAYFLHCEDLDLFERARAAGWSVLFDPQAVAVHAKGISHRRRRLASERDKHRGMVRFYRRHFASRTPGPLRWVWPSLVWTRYVLLAPWWWLSERRAAAGDG